MRLWRRSKPKAMIPTASMADIAFLLILFFMLTTVFRAERGLRIVLPEAEATERILKRRNVSHIWMDREGRISIDDNLMDLARVRSVMELKLMENPDLIVGLRGDQGSPYGNVNDLLEVLKEARALRVTFATEFEEL